MPVFNQIYYAVMRFGLYTRETLYRKKNMAENFYFSDLLDMFILLFMVLCKAILVIYGNA